MKKNSLLFPLIAFFLLSPLLSLAQRADFSGNWVLDKTKTSMAADQLTLIKLQIRMTGDSLNTVRVYDRGDGQEYPFNENVGLDGKECKIVIYDMPRRSKATLSEQEGFLAFESTTTFSNDSGPSDYISKEVWKLSGEKRVLTIDFKNNIGGNEIAGTLYFNKVEDLK
jgi:hypothetical protein